MHQCVARIKSKNIMFHILIKSRFFSINSRVFSIHAYVVGILLVTSLVFVKSHVCLLIVILTTP